MVKSTHPYRLLQCFGLLSCLLLACRLSSLTPKQESEPTPIMTTTTSAVPQETFSLPAPLYYLSNGQIWRLSVDMQTQQQITGESTPIDSFDTTPASGMLVYTSSNSLIITDLDGSNRQVLRAGPVLTPIPDDLARLNDIDHITSAIRTPVWSPDGKQIAFVENGLQVFDLETNQVEQIWHQSLTSSEPYLVESALSWSPDGKHLLLSQYTYPIDTLGHRWLGVLELGGQLYMKIATATQASFAWSPNAADLYLANAAYGTDRSLMRCGLETMQCQLIAEFEPARWYYHYAYPFVTAEERLLVFMGASDDPDRTPETFSLINLSRDGFERTNLRSDGYFLDSAIWSLDGSGVLITLAQAANEHPAGSTLWLNTSDGPAIPLPMMNTSNLRWGSP